MRARHLQKTDTAYKIYLYIFYVCGFMMVSITVFGIYSMLGEWEENGTYVMGEVLVTTEIPFEGFGDLPTIARRRAFSRKPDVGKRSALFCSADG